MEHDDGSCVARVVADYLRHHGLVLVTAESCTAGLIAATLAAVSGAGKMLESAFVVYNPASKQRCLGVPPEVMERFNLTSEPMALAMATGALRQSDADLAVANTGVADDTDPDIEPGTQCFAWVYRTHGETRSFSETKVFAGSRDEIREAAADHALRRIPHYHALLS